MTRTVLPRIHIEPYISLLYLQVTIDHAGARQALKLRQRYLRAALRQDITHFETELTSGQVLSGIKEDCSAVQNAISQKVGNAIHHLATVVASLTLAIVRGWRLALVMLALMPLIAAAGGVLAKVLTSGSTKRAEAYAKANTMSNQAISNMRTVQSFQAEEGILSQYSDLLDFPRRISIRLSAFSGIAQGFVNAVIFVTCAALLSNFTSLL
jgi:ATP-binding cassette, subfamily B (MDR/TAP), member 1